MSTLLDGAVKRASSRAAVLQGLSDNYNRKVASGKPVHSAGSTAIPKSPGNRSSNPLPQNVTVNAVRIFREIIHDGESEKTRQFLSENLGGKTILMDNAKGVISATSSLANSKTKRGRQVSNSILKRTKLADPLVSPSVGDIFKLHNLWWGYMKALVAHCRNDVQLQARLSAADMVGARVHVLESTFASLRNVKGIITAVSKNCFYIVVDPKLKKSSTGLSVAAITSMGGKEDSVSTETDVRAHVFTCMTTPQQIAASSSSSQHAYKKNETVFKVVRAVKTECTFAIMLPRIFGAATLHGGKDNNDNDDGSDEKEDDKISYDAVASSCSTQVNTGVSKNHGGFEIRFDYNEIADGGRVCILHGPLFMPFVGTKI